MFMARFVTLRGLRVCAAQHRLAAARARRRGISSLVSAVALARRIFAPLPLPQPHVLGRRCRRLPLLVSRTLWLLLQQQRWLIRVPPPRLLAKQ
jgi:hypothetical protein